MFLQLPSKHQLEYTLHNGKKTELNFFIENIVTKGLENIALVIQIIKRVL